MILKLHPVLFINNNTLQELPLNLILQRHKVSYAAVA